MICSEKERESCNVEKLGCNGCFYRELTNEEVEQCIKDLTKVRPEMLDDKGLKLFKVIMQILDERDRLRADNYAANNIINDYIEERQKLIDMLERVVDDDEISDVEYQIKRELASEILSILKR